jgi:hypothetical protein
LAAGAGTDTRLAGLSRCAEDFRAGAENPPFSAVFCNRSATLAIDRRSA